MKKFIVLLSFIALILLCFSCGGPKNTDFTYEINDGSVTITGTNLKTGVIKVPEKIEGHKVEVIGRSAFSSLYDVESIELPEGIKKIESNAFELCIGIKEIKLPESLEVIGNAAFSKCRGLLKVIIPKNVKQIGLCAFMGCKNVEFFEVDDSSEFFVTDDYGALFDKSMKTLINYPLASTVKEYEVPDEVTEIGIYAFSGASELDSVVLPNGIEEIASYAFSQSGISEIEFPDSLRVIGDFAFSETNLVIINTNKVEEIGNSAFSWCSQLVTAVVGDSVKKMGNDVFGDCAKLENKG